MIDDSILMAYVDGELDPVARRNVEREAQASADIAARLREHEALRQAIAGVFEEALDEPVPPRLVEAASRPGPAAAVVDLAAARRARAGLAVGGMLAAAGLAAIVVQGVPALRPAPVMVLQGDRLVAHGALAHALDGQLASEQTPGQPIRIGLTVRAADGRYCRTFLDRPARLAGLACREPSSWSVQIAAVARAETGAAAYRMAGDETPPAILEAAQALGPGPALGPRDEAVARTRGWR